MIIAQTQLLGFMQVREQEVQVLVREATVVQVQFGQTLGVLQNQSQRRAGAQVQRRVAEVNLFAQGVGEGGGSPHRSVFVSAGY